MAYLVDRPNPTLKSPLREKIALMDKIPEKIDSKFRYVLLAATRAEQLMRGATPKVEIRSGKLTRIAMEEVLRETVRWEYGLEPMPVEPPEGPPADPEAPPVI